MLKTTALIAVLFGGLLAQGQDFEHPGGLHPRSQIESVKRKLATGEEPWTSAYAQLLEKADNWLSEKPDAVENYRVPGYYSDGKQEHIRLKTLLSEDSRVAYACALVWQLDHNLSDHRRARFGDKAVEILNSWAYKNRRVQKPTDDYAADGDGPLCMCYNGTALVFAAELVWNYDGWTDGDKRQFKNWTKKVFYDDAAYLRHSGDHKYSNRGSWGTLASLAAHHLLGDRAGLANDIALLKDQIDRQIAGDGRMPAELDRDTNSMWYTFFGLAPMTASIEIVRNATGEDLYQWQPPSGGTVQDALNYLFQYGYVEPSRWPVAGSRNMFDDEEAAPVLYQAMAAVYENETWLKSVKPPVWRDSTGLAWICPTLMQPSARSARGGDARRFDPTRDLISLHYDHAPDRDDGHSAAADRTILQTRFGQNWIRRHVVPVSGAYGTNRDTFVADSDSVMDATWRELGGWLSAHQDWDLTTDELAKRWCETLEAGGDIWVKEGGQSDLTADVVRHVKTACPQIATSRRIHVVQHSRWNENKTTKAALDFVKRNSNYIKIPDANRFLKVEGGNADFTTAAKRHPQYGQSWTAAFAYYDPNKILDFSDTGELMYILGLGEIGIDSFRGEFLLSQPKAK